MRCKDCSSFRADTNMEAGTEISPNVKAMKGKCSINDKSCGAMDKCSCGGFTKR